MNDQPPLKTCPFNNLMAQNSEFLSICPKYFKRLSVLNIVLKGGSRTGAPLSPPRLKKWL